MKPFAVIFGLGASVLSIIVLMFLATQTTCDIYTTSWFQNLLQIIIILETGIIVSESVTDSTAREVGIDSIVVIIASVITHIIYYNSGIILFSGQWLFFDLIKKLFIPTLVVTCFASFNGAQGVTSFIAKQKLKKVG